mgnify:CR=1 FL=1
MKNAFLLSLSHGPLAVALPVIWLALLPAFVFAFKHLRRLPTMGSLLMRVLLVVTELVLTVLVLLGFFHVGCAREKAWEFECRQNLQEISAAILAYVQDWDEHLPPASGWMSAAKPYLPKGEANRVFSCPSANSPFGYAFNDALSGLPVTKVFDPAATVMIFESDATKPNAHGGLTILPKIPRHFIEGDTYAFVDGGTKWIRRVFAASLRWKP